MPRNSRTGHLPREPVELGAVAGALLGGLQVAAHAAAADCSVSLVRRHLPWAAPCHTVETRTRQGAHLGKPAARARNVDLSQCKQMCMTHPEDDAPGAFGVLLLRSSCGVPGIYGRM